VILDEFQRVVEEGGREAEAQIRAAVQLHHHVAYVFAGSKTRLLADMTSDPGRPFYKLGEVRFVGAVPRPEFVAFLERGFAAGKIAVEPGAAEALLDAVDEVPYNVQLLAHACWDACRAGGEDGGPTPLTAELVQRTRDAVALRSDPIYTQLWTALPSTQQRALLALIRERGEGLASTDVARRYRMPVPDHCQVAQAARGEGRPPRGAGARGDPAPTRGPDVRGVDRTRRADVTTILGIIVMIGVTTMMLMMRPIAAVPST
jgi:hypothetical protein